MFKGSFKYGGRDYLFKFLAAGAAPREGDTCKTDCLFYGLTLDPAKGTVYVLQRYDSGWMQPGQIFQPTALGRAAIAAAGK